MDWTEDKIEEMIALLAAGKSASYVGALFGCSRNAIIGKHQRERVKRGFIPARRSERILEHIATEETVSPELKRNSTPKRIYRPTKATPEVSTVGLGFLLPAMEKPSSKPAKAPRVGILDVTGCRWAIDEDSKVIGSKVFCNAPQCDGSAYCDAHRAESVADYSRVLIRATVKAALHVMKRRAA